MHGEVEMRVLVPFNCAEMPLEPLSLSSVSLSASPKLQGYLHCGCFFSCWILSLETLGSSRAGCVLVNVAVISWYLAAKTSKKKKRGKKFPLRPRRNENEKYSDHITLSEIIIWSIFCEISALSRQGLEKRAENDQRP